MPEHAPVTRERIPMQEHTTPLPSHLENTLPAAATSGHRRVSWGAILAGVAIALSLQLLFNILGLGVGASTIDVRQDGAPGSGLAIGAGVWFAVSALISLFVGGWAAGRMAGVPTAKDGMLHGFTTWSITSILTIFLLSSAVGSIIGGSASLLGRAGALTGQSAAAAAPTVTNMISQATGVTPADVKQQAGDLASDPRFQTFVQQSVSQGDVTPEARTNLVQLVATKQGISEAQANDEVNTWQSKLQQAAAQAKSTAVNAADKTASGVSQAALWSFAALLLGAIAATVGGMVGSPRLHTHRVATVPTVI